MFKGLREGFKFAFSKHLNQEPKRLVIVEELYLPNLLYSSVVIVSLFNYFATFSIS